MAVIRYLDLRGMAPLTAARVRELLPRAELDVDAALAVVAPICARVRERGTAAVIEYSEQFDGVRTDALRVPPAALPRAAAALAPGVLAAIKESIARLRRCCQAELDADVPTEDAVELAPGAVVRRRLVPVGRVGCYVPGGLASLASSVAMNVVPAQVAGVGSMAIASPPRTEFGGRPHPVVLGVCGLLGVDEVYAMGGAQAIAALAYGVDGCPPVDLITGPGSVYVTAAKRLLSGVVGIDSEAGPTEIAILADDSAHPRHVAADLISQAEHDPAAAAVLVTPSEQLAVAVETELAGQLPMAKHAERITSALSGRQSAIVLTDDLPAAIAVVDAYAAEHLEIQTADADAVAAQIGNAGAIFVGPYSPVSLGDYCAGSNHVLPTGGSARYSAGLSVRSFVRTMQVVGYGEAALRAVAGDVRTLADAENLPAHGSAVTARFDRPEDGA